MVELLGKVLTANGSSARAAAFRSFAQIFMGAGSPHGQLGVPAASTLYRRQDRGRDPRPRCTHELVAMPVSDPTWMNHLGDLEAVIHGAVMAS